MQFLFISGAEIFFILFIVVMVFGKGMRQLKDATESKGMRQLKDATDDIKREIQNSTDIDTDFTKDIRKEIDDVKKNVNEVSGSIKRDLNKK